MKPKPLDRLMTYSAAVLCGALLWLGIASPADAWQKWAGLGVGVLGLVGVCAIISCAGAGGRAERVSLL